MGVGEQKLSDNPKGCPSYFSLRRQRKVTKRNATRHRAVAAAPRRFPALLAGFGPARTRASMRSNMRAFPPKPAALLGALTGAESQKHKQQLATARSPRRPCGLAAHALAPAPALPLLPPPSTRTEQRSHQPGKGATVRAHGCASSHRPVDGEQRRAQLGHRPSCARLGCPSLWLLSLGQARESNSDSPKGWPKAFAFSRPIEKSPIHPNPLPHQR